MTTKKMSDYAEPVELVADLYQANTDECGWVTREELQQRYEDGGVKYALQEDRALAAADYAHVSSKGITKVYRTAVSDESAEEWRGRIIDRIMQESPFGVIETLVPVDSSENNFWKDKAEHVGREPGKKRMLNRYRMVDDRDGVLDL